MEAPDPWLNNANPWELPRTDVTVEVRFYGHAERIENNKAIWSGGQEVLAVAYDVMIPGYHTKTVVSKPFSSSDRHPISSAEQLASLGE